MRLDGSNIDGQFDTLIANITRIQVPGVIALAGGRSLAANGNGCLHVLIPVIVDIVGKVKTCTIMEETPFGPNLKRTVVLRFQITEGVRPFALGTKTVLVADRKFNR